MNENKILDGYGQVCLNSALVVQLSWIPALGFLDGSTWATPLLAGRVHFAAIAFMLALPLGFGFRLWQATPAPERGAVLKDWFARCFLPPAFFALALQAAVRFTPNVTIPTILALMLATLPLGVYGVMLHKEAVRAR